MESVNNATWDKVIVPNKRLFDIQIGDIWGYRGLIYMLLKRDFITYYKQTILGPLWYLVQPICSTIMYAIVFGNLARIGTDSIPQVLFYFSGSMLWAFFSENLIKTSNIFFDNKALFGKIYFPRLVVPISTTAGRIMKLAIQFAMFFIMFLKYVFIDKICHLSLNLLLSPLIIIWIAALSCGIGMVISSITTKYRDIALVLEFFISLVMYATPVVYPISEVGERMRFFLCLNPMSAPIELFRYSFFEMSSIPMWSVIYSMFFTVIILMVGLLMFNQNEQTFVDVI